MNYGNHNPQNNNNCYYCSNNIGKHAVNLITSDAATEKLARKLQNELDGVYKKALQKGYTLPQGTIMVGSIIAKLKDSTVKAVALSGGNAHAIMDIIGKSKLGKDVDMVSDNVPLNAYKSIIGSKLRTQVTNVNNSRVPAAGVIGFAGVGGLAPIQQPNYPVGSCAAQKLIHHLVTKAGSKKILSINMAEIFWKTNGVQSQWSTGQVVESCNTCRYIIPMMLCNYDDLGNPVPYP